MAQIIETLAVKVVADASDYESEMAKLPKSVEKVEQSIAGFTQKIGDSMQAWGKSISSFGDSMARFGTKWSLAVTAPIVALGKNALESAAEFEKAMNKIAVSTGASSKEMQVMQQLALKLGKDTVFSAGDAAQAMLELSKAGLGTKEVMGAIPGVLSLAAAGELDLGQAAEIAANAMNAFGLDASQTTDVANMLAAAANASSADVGDLAYAFQMSAAPFALYGQHVDDLATALAIMANNGIKGSDAGTSLKVMMQRLAAPTDKAGDLMKFLGLEIYDSTGKMKPFRKIVQNMISVFGKMSEAERNSALQTIFGTDAIRAAAIVMKDGIAGWDAMHASVTKAGAAEEMANANMKGLAGAIEYFKGTLDSLLIQTSLPWLDTLSQMIRKAADLIAKFGELDPAVQRNVVIFLALAAAAGPVLIYVGMLISAVGSMISGFGALIAAGGAVIGFLAGLSAPILLAIAAVVAFGIAYATNFMGIRDITNSVVATAVEWLGRFVQVLMDLGRYLLAVVQDGDYLNDWLSHLPEPIQFAAEILGRLVAAVRSLVEAVIHLVYAGSALLQGDWKTAWLEAQLAVNSAIEAIKLVLGSMVDIFNAILPVLPSSVANAFAVIQGIVDVGMKAVGQIIQVGMNLLQGNWGSAWENVKGLINAALISIYAVVDSALGGIGELFGVNMKEIQWIFLEVWYRISQVIGGIIGIVEHTVKAVAALLRGEWTAAWNEAVAVVQSAINMIMRVIMGPNWDSIGEGIAQGIVRGIQSGWNMVTDAAKGAAQAAINAAKSALGIASPSKVAADEVGHPFAAGIREGAMRGLSALSADITRGLDVTVSGIRTTQAATAAPSGFGLSNLSIPVTINIAGNADEQSVRRGSQSGLIDALRQAGLM